MRQDTVSSVTDAVYQDELISEDPLIVNLCGRDNELDYLINAYELVKERNSYIKVIISGHSGSGKTFLVSAFQQKVLQNNGFFCSGKHFQNSCLGQDLYPALISAFSDLCDIVLQAESLDEKWRSEIREALGEDGDLLANAGTNIAPFLDGSPCFSSSSTKSEPSFAKFTTVCRIFLRVMSSSEHPVVLFLDDAQWADAGTKRLLDAILKDTEIKNFMLILAYRDDEASSVIKSHLENISDCHLLKLRNLDFSGLKEMVSGELSGSTLEDCDGLCELISRKTQGNPFHVKQFVDSIKKYGLLQSVDGKWICDVEVVRAEMMISDCLADLLSSKVQRLDNYLQEILRIASLLGYHFLEGALRKIANEYFKSKQSSNILDLSDQMLRSFLGKAVDEGFLEKIGHGYQFSHDKLQFLFQQSMATDVRERLHLLIGRQYLLCQSSNSTNSFIYQAAVHLNIASKNHFITEEERVELARTNLQASKYCEFRSAYVESVSFLQKGLDLLDNQKKWSDNFDLSFALTESLARMHFFVGNLEGCKAVNREVALWAKSFEAKIKSFQLNVDVHISDDDLTGLISAGRKEIKKLGLVRLQRKAMLTPFNLLLTLIKVRKLVDKKTDEEILTLPYSQDSKLSTTIFILMRLCLLCNLRQQYTYGCFCALLAMELTMTMGISLHAPNVIYVYGAIEVANFFGERVSGGRWFRMSELALKFLNKFSFKDAECHIIPGLAMNVLYRRRHIQKILDIYPDALKDGYEKGDIISHAVCAAYTVNFRIWMGENLQSLEKDFRGTHKQISDLGQSMLLMPLQPALQLVLNMQNGKDAREDLVFLNGEIMNEKSFMNRCTNKNESFQCILFMICKIYLAYTFGFYEMAEELSKSARLGRSFILEQSFLSFPFDFYTAMIYYERHRSTGLRKYVRMARNILKVFTKGHIMGNPNATPYFELLELEDLSITNPKNVRKLYSACESSIAAQITAGFTHLEALAYERAACILADLDKDKAKKYHDHAMQIYRVKWGALAKYKSMQENADSAPPVRIDSVKTPAFEILVSHDSKNSPTSSRASKHSSTFSRTSKHSSTFLRESKHSSTSLDKSKHSEH